MARSYYLRPLKEKLSVSIDNDIVTMLREEAEYDGRTLSQLMNVILRRYCETNLYSKYNRPTPPRRNQ